ncbi:HNH endonuclease [Shouchella rhizosphaerae]|uniref:HNH endonuclease n=1 Tax=Shouchella rhizosphaerae TaxID=866786 RepID=UPI003F7E3145
MAEEATGKEDNIGGDIMALRKDIEELLGNELDNYAERHEELVFLMGFRKDGGFKFFKADNYPLLTVLDRVRREEKLYEMMSYIDRLYERGPKRFKEFMDYKYKQNNSWYETANKFGLSGKTAMKVRKLMILGLAEALGMDREGEEKASRYVPAEIRRAVIERDKGKCTECGNNESLHLHHLTPFADGGLHTVENLVLLCGGCHADAHAGQKAEQILRAMA